MNSQELKELVKAHFSLVEAPSTEETFGEVMDVNKAFTIVFPGERLEVGAKVMVRTTEGQEMEAPDGTHELENGLKIITEGSVVKEIMDATATEEEAAKVEMQEEVDEEGVVAEDVEMEDEVSTEDVVEAIVEAVKEEIEAMKAEMAAMKQKMESYMDEPAVDKSLPTAFNKTTAPKAIENVLDVERFNRVMSNYKNKLTQKSK